MSETTIKTDNKLIVSLKQRLVGALVLVSLAIIFIPMILDGDGPFETRHHKTFIPEEPRFEFESPSDINPVAKNELTPDDLADDDADVSIVDTISEAAISHDTPSAKPGSPKLVIIDKNSSGDTSDDVMPAPISPLTNTQMKSTVRTKEPAAVAQKSRALSNPAARIAKLKNNKDKMVESWSVQLGSFKAKLNALKLRDKLREKGFAAYVDAKKGTNGATYRVRVGPERTRASVKRLKKRLAGVSKLDALIVTH